MSGQRPLILLGAGGHAKVLLALARAAAVPVEGVCDPSLAVNGIGQWLGVPVIGADDALDTLDPATVFLANGIGQVPFSQLREKLFTRCMAKGFSFASLVHPAAWVAPDAILEEGSQVMAGSIVQSAAKLGMNSVVNTRASIDHDCNIGAHVHVAPGAVLCGSVRVGDRAFIGAGATVIQGIQVGACAVIGAGATVVRDVADDAVVLGAKGNMRSRS
jgi:UDP-perosamine 4-acetyltransferase